MAVPSHLIELGLGALLKTVNRDIYPKEDYPYGQWSYMVYYEQSFEKATAFFDADPGAFLRLVYGKGDPSALTKPAITANVVKEGGWLGGLEKPDPNWKHIPAERICIPEDEYAELTASMEKTSFFGADAWYMNHKRNHEYTLRSWKNDGFLHMPVLFIEAKFDTVCATSTSTGSEPMRKHCTNLTEVSIDAGHWVAQEKPEETNAAMARWLVEKLKTQWPGYWTNKHADSKL